MENGPEDDHFPLHRRFYPLACWGVGEQFHLVLEVIRRVDVGPSRHGWPSLGLPCRPEKSGSHRWDTDGLFDCPFCVLSAVSFRYPVSDKSDDNGPCKDDFPLQVLQTGDCPLPCLLEGGFFRRSGNPSKHSEEKNRFPPMFGSGVWGVWWFQNAAP